MSKIFAYFLSFFLLVSLSLNFFSLYRISSLNSVGVGSFSELNSLIDSINDDLSALNKKVFDLDADISTHFDDNSESFEFIRERLNHLSLQIESNRVDINKLDKNTRKKLF